MQDWIVFHCLSLGPSFWFIPRHSRRIWCSVCPNWLENTIAADPNITTWTHSRTVLPLWLATPCCFLCSDVRLGPTSIGCPHQCAWKPREIQPGLVEYIISWVTLRHGTLTVCNGECGFRTLGQCVFRCRPNKTQRFLMHLSHWDVFFLHVFPFSYLTIPLKWWGLAFISVFGLGSPPRQRCPADASRLWIVLQCLIPPVCEMLVKHPLDSRFIQDRNVSSTCWDRIPSTCASNLAILERGTRLQDLTLMLLRLMLNIFRVENLHLPVLLFSWGGIGMLGTKTSRLKAEHLRTVLLECVRIQFKV